MRQVVDFYKQEAPELYNAMIGERDKVRARVPFRPHPLWFGRFVCPRLSCGAPRTSTPVGMRAIGSGASFPVSKPLGRPCFTV